MLTTFYWETDLQVFLFWPVWKASSRSHYVFLESYMQAEFLNIEFLRTIKNN